MKRALCAVLLLFFSCPASFSQAKHASVKLMFECQCKDETGMRFASAFRELLAASPRYSEVNQSVEQPANENVVIYNWHLKVISVDGSAAASGTNAALSLVLLRGDDIFVWQSVQLCGRLRADACARTALATMDDRIAAWGN